MGPPKKGPKGNQKVKRSIRFGQVRKHTSRLPSFGSECQLDSVCFRLHRAIESRFGNLGRMWLSLNQQPWSVSFWVNFLGSPSPDAGWSQSSSRCARAASSPSRWRLLRLRRAERAQLCSHGIQASCGCGSQPMPFWGRCPILACSLGVRDFDSWTCQSAINTRDVRRIHCGIAKTRESPEKENKQNHVDTVGVAPFHGRNCPLQLPRL